MSHLPEAVYADLAAFINEVDERLQAEAFKITRAIDVDRGFDEGFISSALFRGMFAKVAERSATNRLHVERMANGGVEAVSLHDGVERRFRLRRAKVGRGGRMDVRVGSDSLLTHRARAAELFDELGPELFPTTHEQWIIPYIVNPLTLTLYEVAAAFPVGISGETSPFRLMWGDFVVLPLGAAPSPSFPGDEDDLKLFDDDAQSDDGDIAAG